jgi:hypothetical protein
LLPLFVRIPAAECVEDKLRELRLDGVLRSS